MTNIGEYNFAQNVSLNLYQLNAKNERPHSIFSFLVKKQKWR